MVWTIDHVIFILFLILNIIFGLKSSKGIKNIREYAVGDGSFNTSTIVATTVATWMCGETFFSTITETYQHGLYFLLPCLSINPSNSEEIVVLVNVLKSTPIKSSTMAQLTSQGITGLSYINLSFGDDSAAPLKRENGQEYPVIKTIPSLLIKLENTLGDITLNLSDTLQRLSGALRDENQKEITLLLKNSNIFISKLNKTLDDKTIDDFQETMKNLNSASKKLDDMFPRIEKFINGSSAWEESISKSFTSISNSYLGIKDSMDTFKGAVKSGDFNIKEITNDLLPTINNTLIEMQNLIIKMQETLDAHERSPADVLFMQEEIKKGPGEK